MARLAARPFPAFASSLHGRVLSPSMILAPDGKSTLFSVANLASGAVEKFSVPLTLAHSWTERPGMRGVGTVPESGGSNCCIVDSKRKKVLLTFQTSGKDLVWGGHAAYTPDGKLLVLSQFSDSTGKGTMSIRSADTGAEVRQVSSHGLFPHELYSKDAGKRILVANLGWDSHKKMDETVNLTLVDLASGHSLESKLVRSDPKLVQADPKKFPERLLPEASYFLQVGDLIAERPRKVGLVLHPHAKALSIWRPGRPYELLRYIDFSPLQIVGFTWVGERSHLAVALNDQTLRFFKKGTWQLDATLPVIASFPSSTHVFADGSDM